MSVDDILYSPIVADAQLRALVKKILDNPTDQHIFTTVSAMIVDLFGNRGVTDDKEIADAILRSVDEIRG